MKKAVIAVALSVLAALLSANVNTVAHAQGNLVAPSNVTAQHTGNPGEVRISWGAVPNAAYYRIGWVAYSDVAPIIASGGDWLEHFAFIDIENRGQTEHFITRLTPGVQYAFIMASNDGRYGTPRWPSSAGWAFLTLTEAPATHASLGSTAINLTWDAVPGATYYRVGWVVYEDVAPIIARGGDWLEHFAFIDIANRGQTEHTITRLTPGLLYAFIVAGNDGRYGTPQWPPASAWQFMTPSVVQPTGPDSDRAALITLYNATGGANWMNRTGWLSAAPMGEWDGVTTDESGRVVQLLLRENNLAGRIPVDLGNLTALTRLDFQGNKLTGSIPSTLGNLSNLDRLDLDHNQLTGQIPTQLRNLTNLRLMDLDNNRLDGPIPSWLGSMTGLEWLSIGSNPLGGSIPPELGNLTNLQVLGTLDAHLTGTIPTELGNLSNLAELNLSSNNLRGAIPPELGRLTKLTYMSLRSNGLTGPIPSELGNMSSLESLYLFENRLSGPIPTELENLSNLEGLVLHDNQLSGSVPAWLGNLSRLRSLNLRINRFTGEIPTELGSLSNLTYLNLRSNELTGPVPTELGNLSNLEQLYLYENKLSGEIPDSLGRLSNLARLSLYNNMLTGDVPASLGSLTKLEFLRLAGNQLTGCVPTALQNVADTDFATLGLPFCGAAQARQFSPEQLGALFDEIISKTEQREAFSDVKERNLGYSAIGDMKALRAEFVASTTETKLYHSLVKLSNARRDTHLRVETVDGGLPAPDRSCASAPIHVLPDYTDINNPTFFVAGLTQGRTSPGVGDVIVSVNGRSIAGYVEEITPWIPHSSLHGLYWRMAFGLPKQIPTTTPRLYSEALNLRLENSSGQRYEVSLPYSYGCYSMNSRHSTAGFDQVMRRENFNVLVDRNRQLVLLQWLDFDLDPLIEDIPALMEYAEREQILDYDMIMDVSWSSGGSGGAYAIQRLVHEPFRVTFGNVRLSDLGIERVQRYVDREPDTSEPDIFGLNLSRSWLYEWASTDATEAIRRGSEYTPPVPFKLAHLPKDSDGMLQPAPAHFSGEVAIINARVWGGSHLDQFMAMFVDNDLATFIGMPTGGFSNTWEGEEVLRLPETGRPLVNFQWSIGHTIRPNGEVLEGNPAEPDIYIPLTRENFLGHHQMLFDTALAALGR